MNKKNLIKSHYKNVFNKPWGKTWYVDVITPIVSSIIKNEQILKEQEKNIHKLNINKEWQPIELIIETQIGLILILCQTYINSVIGKVSNLHNDYKSILNIELEDLQTKRKELIKIGSKCYNNPNY